MAAVVKRKILNFCFVTGCSEIRIDLLACEAKQRSLSFGKLTQKRGRSI